MANVVEDRFGQEVNAGDVVLWANKLKGRPKSLDTCVVDSFTKTGQIRLQLPDGELRTAVFGESLAKVELMDNQDIQVGDLVVAGYQLCATRCSVTICEVTKLTPRRVELKIDDPRAWQPEITVNYNQVAKISAAEKTRLEKILTEYRARLKVVEDAYFAKLEASGKNPFVIKGNSLTFNPDI